LVTVEVELMSIRGTRKPCGVVSRETTLKNAAAHNVATASDLADGLAKTACPAQRSLKLAVRAWTAWLVADHHVMVAHPYLQSVSDRPVPGLTQYFCPGPPTCSETPYSDFQPGLTTGQCQKTISPAYGPAYREPNVGQLVDSAVILGLHWVTHVISSMFSLRSKGGRGGVESVMWNHDEHVRRR
jgi:hypothetical protein